MPDEHQPLLDLVTSDGRTSWVFRSATAKITATASSAAASANKHRESPIWEHVARQARQQVRRQATHTAGRRRVARGGEQSHQEPSRQQDECRQRESCRQQQRESCRQQQRESCRQRRRTQASSRAPPAVAPAVSSPTGLIRLEGEGSTGGVQLSSERGVQLEAAQICPLVRSPNEVVDAALGLHYLSC